MTNTKKCEPAVRKQQLAPPQQTASKSPSVLLSQWSELCSQSVCNSHISSHLSGAIPPLEGGNDKVPLLLFWPKKRKKSFIFRGGNVSQHQGSVFVIFWTWCHSGREKGERHLLRCAGIQSCWHLTWSLKN